LTNIFAHTQNRQNPIYCGVSQQHATQWQRRYVACLTCYLYCFHHCHCCCHQRCCSGNHCCCPIHYQAFCHDPTLHDVRFCQEFLHACRHSHALHPNRLASGLLQVFGRLFTMEIGSMNKLAATTCLLYTVLIFSGGVYQFRARATMPSQQAHLLD